MNAAAVRILDVVEAIPPGQVLSYGEVAARAGVGSPRLVGRVLAAYGGEVPWHRVLRADGTVARHLRHRQLALLRAEGVAVVGDRVDLGRPRR